jgi:integrase
MTSSPDARKYVTEEELKRFFAAIKSVRDRAIFTLAYWRGLRASEIGSLPWTAWNQKKRVIWISRLKGSLSGEYPLSPAETKALTAWRELRGNEPGWMFPSRNSASFELAAGGKGKKSGGIGRGMIHLLFCDYATKAGLPAELRHEHALKHSIATHLVSKGADVLAIKDWIGHADIRSTMVYLQIRNPKRLADAQKIYQQG